MRTVKDLFTKEELLRYEQTHYPFNLSILHNALKAQLELDPDYEVWVPFVYYKNANSPQAKSPELVRRPYKILISNKGNVCSLRGRIPKPLYPYLVNNKYIDVCIQTEMGSESFKLHRALACAFIPIPPELGGTHPNRLEVNHVNAVKTNFSLDNLEWTTPIGNMAHAHALGLNPVPLRPNKGVVVFGEYAGLEFVLAGKKAILENGFKPPNVTACCKGRSKRHRGCIFTYATKDEVNSLPNGISEEVRKALSVGL
jgi:hypothetical protein